MGDILLEALTKYYHALEVKGYMSRTHSEKLLVIAFYWDFMYNDYRALLSKEDYRLIERALDCIYGTSCLIPYPDYLKMGKLHLGEMTEMAQRVKTLEETEVVKVIHDLDSVNSDIQSDVLIMAEE
jgi:hypothetical protein